MTNGLRSGISSGTITGVGPEPRPSPETEKAGTGAPLPTRPMTPNDPLPSKEKNPMAETQATQPTGNTTDDAPVTPRFRFAADLPGRLGEDRYVRYIAETCDQARDDLDREQARLSETRDELSTERSAHMDALLRNVEKDREIARLNARSVWTPAQVTTLAWQIGMVLLALAFIAMITLTTVFA